MIDHSADPNAPDIPGQDDLEAAGDEAASDGATSDGATSDGERVAKALARAGVASRREVERLIEAGRVSLNGRVLDTPAVRIAPGDVLTVDGAVVAAPEPARVWRYHKPVGLVTTHKDPKARPTVFDHLPAGLPRVISVGRLDLNTEGLLLLTNDGALARALELPATGLARRYRARARGHATQDKLDRLKDGLTVEGVRYGSIDARLDKAKEGATGANLWITLTLHEGKNREVRKVLEALGLTVNRLIRLAYGPFQLGTLEPGAVEEVGPRVIREQLGEFIAPQNLPTGSGAASGPSLKTHTAGAARRGGALVEPKKPVYKAGWAKPKKRVVHAPSKPRRPKPAAGEAAARPPLRGGAKTSKPAAFQRGEARPKSPAARSERPSGTPASPRSPKGSAPPPRSSGAHRRGPPKAGGPKPRG